MLAHMRGPSPGTPSTGPGAGPGGPDGGRRGGGPGARRALPRPLELAPARADLCHAVSNGLAALPALAAKWTFRHPLPPDRARPLPPRTAPGPPAGDMNPHVRSLLLRFFKRLVEATYLMADRIAPVSHYCQLWELKSGARAAQIRPVHNGIDPDTVRLRPGRAGRSRPWCSWGASTPSRTSRPSCGPSPSCAQAVPGARLRMFGPRESASYGERCDALVAELGLGRIGRLRRSGGSAGRGLPGRRRWCCSPASPKAFPSPSSRPWPADGRWWPPMSAGWPRRWRKAGVLVPPRDPAAVAEATITLLGDPERRRSLGRQRSGTGDLPLHLVEVRRRTTGSSIRTSWDRTHGRTAASCRSRARRRRRGPVFRQCRRR